LPLCLHHYLSSFQADISTLWFACLSGQVKRHSQQQDQRETPAAGKQEHTGSSPHGYAFHRTAAEQVIKNGFADSQGPDGQRQHTGNIGRGTGEKDLSGGRRRFQYHRLAEHVQSSQQQQMYTHRHGESRQQYAEMSPEPEQGCYQRHEFAAQGQAFNESSGFTVRRKNRRGQQKDESSAGKTEKQYRYSQAQVMKFGGFQHHLPVEDQDHPADEQQPQQSQKPVHHEPGHRSGTLPGLPDDIGQAGGIAGEKPQGETHEQQAD